MAILETTIERDIDVWPYIHSSMPKSSRLEFYGADSQELYNRNLKYLPTDWRYTNQKIEYNFNNLNLRMRKDIDEVEDRYILFSGTSFGMGVGIDENDRFSEQVSIKLGKDFINCCGPSFTIKAQAISFFNFLKSGLNLPKIFVIEYPPSYAYTYYSDNSFLFYYSKNIPNGNSNHLAAYKHLLETDFFLQESNLYRTMIKSTCFRLGIKFVELSFHKTDNFIISNNISIVDTEDNNTDINYCYARDLRQHQGQYAGHPGVGIHTAASNLILNSL
jgi:hypothetical protein